MAGARRYEMTINPPRVVPQGFDLGQLLHISDSNPFGCPVCIRSTKMTAHRLLVFENGVKFACGCIVTLPRLHRSNGDKCMVCNPRLATVTGLARKWVA